MASNMDREMILADFQVKYLALSPSHLQPRGFPVTEGWPLPSVCLSSTVVCGLDVCGVCVCIYVCMCVVSHGRTCNSCAMLGVCRMCYVRLEWDL